MINSHFRAVFRRTGVRFENFVRHTGGNASGGDIPGDTGTDNRIAPDPDVVNQTDHRTDINPVPDNSRSAATFRFLCELSFPVKRKTSIRPEEIWKFLQSFFPKSVDQGERKPPRHFAFFVLLSFTRKKVSGSPSEPNQTHPKKTYGSTNNRKFFVTTIGGMGQSPHKVFCFVLWSISRLAVVMSLGYIHSMRPRLFLAKRDLAT